MYILGFGWGWRFEDMSSNAASLECTQGSTMSAQHRDVTPPPRSRCGAEPEDRSVQHHAWSAKPGRHHFQRVTESEISHKSYGPVLLIRARLPANKKHLSLYVYIYIYDI